MPVTVTPSTHGAKLVSFGYQRPAQNAAQVLRYACPREQRQCLELLQSSFEPELPTALLPSNNGFVKSIIDCYSSHHHLRIRPEDVWFAILTQLSIYINKHAEELREHFVAHEGRKELWINYDSGDRYSVDFGVFAEEMSHLLQQNVVDPGLRDWMMPAFSTTTKHDTVIASIIMMGSMQKYFSFGCSMSCGLPSVTLLGDKADWELILGRLDKLTTFGQEPTQFSQILRPVISRFIRSFESPTSTEVIDFWQRVLNVNSQMSGSTIYSGWITAFCFWDEDGNSLHALDRYSWVREPNLCLDGAHYHKCDSENVPAGWAKVPVKVNDNGDKFDAVMIAGSVGISCTSSEEELAEDLVGLDTMSAETGWWMFEKTNADAL